MKTVEQKTIKVPLYGIVNTETEELYETRNNRQKARDCLQSYKSTGVFGNELKIAKFEIEKYVR